MAPEALPAGASTTGWCPFATALPSKNIYPQRIDPKDKDRTRHAIRGVILHVTQGTNSIAWLQGDTGSGVSAHFLVRQDGTIYQYVSIHDGAWANGLSWKAGRGWLDPGGKPVQPSWPLLEAPVNPNLSTISIEHEQKDYRKPWTPAQLAASVRLLQWIRQETGLVYRPDETLTGHFAISPRLRANCPGPTVNYAALSDAGNLALADGDDEHTLVPATRAFTEDHPIIGPFSCTVEQARALLLSRSLGEYTAADLDNVILPAYATHCEATGVDLAVAIAQLIHETDNLASFWASRPRRNPAGIGVNGTKTRTKPATMVDWAYNPRTGVYEKGLSFRCWAPAYGVKEALDQCSIPAHVYRLLGYARRDDQLTKDQRALLVAYTARRPLPKLARGSAPTLKPLGRVHNPYGEPPHFIGWASPGDLYGAALARLIARLHATPT